MDARDKPGHDRVGVGVAIQARLTQPHDHPRHLRLTLPHRPRRRHHPAGAVGGGARRAAAHGGLSGVGADRGGERRQCAGLGDQLAARARHRAICKPALVSRQAGCAGARRALVPPLWPLVAAFELGAHHRRSAHRGGGRAARTVSGVSGAGHDRQGGSLSGAGGSNPKFCLTPRANSRADFQQSGHVAEHQMQRGAREGL